MVLKAGAIGEGGVADPAGVQTALPPAVWQHSALSVPNYFCLQSTTVKPVPVPTKPAEDHCKKSRLKFELSAAQAYHNRLKSSKKVVQSFLML